MTTKKEMDAASRKEEELRDLAQFSAHESGDSAYRHAAERTKLSVLGTAVALTLGFSAIELAGGIWSNSLALIGDAGHMVTDSASLLFALIANRIAAKGADSEHTFGHGRVEVLAAFINGLVMLGVVFWLFIEAAGRIRTPEAVSGESVMLIALCGLLVNVGVALSLSRDRHNINTRSALLHVMGDLLGSVAAIAAGAVIWMGGPAIVDPILSIFVGFMLLHATWGILRDSVSVLLDSSPAPEDFVAIGRFLRSIPDVRDVHDLHVWTMSPGHDAVQCHLSIDAPECWPRILREARTGIRRHFGIDHVTIQPEWACRGDCGACRSSDGCPQAECGRGKQRAAHGSGSAQLVQ